MEKIKTVSLAKHLSVSPKILKEKGVMNVILGIDTKLFIDPKLIGKTTIPEFTSAHEDIQNYFQELVRINNVAATSPRLKQRCIDMIAIEEPVGLSTGFGNNRDSGTSIPKTVAIRSLASLNEILSVGMQDMTVMELLGLFTERFGPDSINDLIAKIIYKSLCKYTERVSRELNLTTQTFSIEDANFRLPKHPFKNHQIIFLPRKILSPLPLATSWEDIAYAARMNASIRKSFNEMVGNEIKKFISYIKKNPSLITKSVQNMNLLLKVYNGAEATSYDENLDSLSYDRLVEYSDYISERAAPQVECETTQDLEKYINDEILSQLRRDIEELGANRLLYHRKGETIDPYKPVHEEAFQVLIHITADQLCKNSNILVTRESKTGVGSVDFVLGKGYSNKVVLEGKKSSNKDLIHGYEKQVKAYQKAENASSSFYVVVVVRRKDFINSKSQLNKLLNIHADNVKSGRSCPKLFVIDGLIKKSASER